ncbi:MAG: gamma-glutamylcyclotransferase [Rhizobiales bacterium]|nr:gamma-glutamylcyclotransferase [Hyphomicrobiales bacterium]
MERYVFGYGSLVNAQTHNYTQTHKASLVGWRRVWRRTHRRDLAYLTIVPDPATRLIGVIARVAMEDWDALDLREQAYDRLSLGTEVDHPLLSPVDLVVYSIPECDLMPASATHPILMTYLDAVLHGYLQAYGEEGIDHFIETTDGWETPILNDRDNPLYPRAVPISDEAKRFFDARLKAVGVTILQERPLRDPGDQ